MSKMLLFSVIVPVYNGEKFLPRCLDALFASHYGAYEVIVADDGSTDRSAAISREKGAIVVESERRQSGPAAARNLAVTAKANGDILVFVDADVVVERDTLSKFAKCFENQPEISAVFGSYDDSPAATNFLSQYRNLLHHFVHQTSNREASTFWAGLGAIRKTAFLAVGGFDCERFSVPSIEDIELGARLKKNNHQIVLDGEIQAKHLKRWTAVSILKTDVFCRALPWSKLILTEQGLINDMNLKTSDRASAIFIAASLAVAPFVFWQPLLLLLIVAFLISILYLNRKIFRFFLHRKNLVFAVCAFPWQLLYFFYSGASFVFCWFRYALPQIIGIGKTRTAREIGHLN